MASVNELLRLCRLCLVKDEVHIPIFDEQGDIRQIFLKISACLPVKVSREDNLPKNICDSCSSKLESLYQFWNTSANSEKKLIQWLSAERTERNAQHSMIDPVVLKQEVVEVPDERTSPDHLDDLNVSNDADYLQQQLPYENVEFQFQQDDYEETVTDSVVEVGSVSRKRRAAAIRAIANMGSEDEGNPDLLEPKLAKIEEESEESGGEDPEPTAFVGLPSATDNDQPGPSGVCKQSADAPSLSARLKDAYQLKEAVVVLEDIKGRPAEKSECLNVFGSIYTKPSYTCDKCGKKFADSLKLKCHTMVHKLKMSSPKKKQNLKCYICVKQFSDRNSLWSHMRVHSARQMAQTCKLCRKSFKNAHALTLHASSCPNSNSGKITNTKPKCCVCMREYANVDELRSHRLLHKKEQARKDAPVEDDQKSSNDQKTSDDQNAFVANDLQPIVTERVEATPPQFKCCHQIFQSFDLLCVHMYHKFSVFQESRCIPQYVCSICSTTFNDRSDWCQHSTKRHGCDETALSQWEQSLTCDRCEKVFTDSIKVMQHKLVDCKTDEPADEPAPDEITSIVVQNSVYNGGTTAVTETRPVLRTYSRKVVKDPAGVKTYERKPVENDVITIDESDDEIDTGQSYTCKLCSFTSTEFPLLQEHCINTHKIPFVCPKCTNWYMSLALYNRHLCQPKNDRLPPF